MIALVDAYDAPNAASDLAKFSIQFGLPTAKFPGGVCERKEARVRHWVGTGSVTRRGVGSRHGAECEDRPGRGCLQQLHRLMIAEDMASKMVNAAGGGEVSNSWGGSEFNGETAFDSHFVKTGVVFLASAGRLSGNKLAQYVAQCGGCGRHNGAAQPIDGCVCQRSSLGHGWRRHKRN